VAAPESGIEAVAGAILDGSAVDWASYPVRAKNLTDLRQADALCERTDIRSARADLPARLTRVIERAVDPEPGRRYESADALAGDLATIHRRPKGVRAAYGRASQAALRFRPGRPMVDSSPLCMASGIRPDGTGLRSASCRPPADR
jgi:hypothetical protein